MPRFRIVSLPGAALLAAMLPAVTCAEERLTIAVASNFANAATEVIAEFTKETGVPARLSSGSTGHLYAQIINGAPYDVFLAADERRPKMLEQSGLAVLDSRATYAFGSLVLWSADESMLQRDCRAALNSGSYRHLAIANPATAPYGLAAKEFLISIGIWDQAAGRIVFGENISQTLQFVATGNASLGFVAWSQLSGELSRQSVCSWKVPTSQHSEIAQQAVAISGSRFATEATQFLSFLSGPQAAEILNRHGYEVPK